MPIRPTTTSFYVKDTDRGYKKTLERAAAAKGMFVSAGIHKTEAERPHRNAEGGWDDASIGEIAGWLEFGTSQMPAREWLRGYIDGLPRGYLEGVAKKAYQEYMDDKISLHVALGRLGKIMRDGIKQKILSGMITPADAQATLDKKRPETRPLVEGGQFVESITYKVQKGSIK